MKRTWKILFRSGHTGIWIIICHLRAGWFQDIPSLIFLIYKFCVKRHTFRADIKIELGKFKYNLNKRVIYISFIYCYNNCISLFYLLYINHYLYITIVLYIYKMYPYLYLSIYLNHSLWKKNKDFVTIYKTN